MKYNFPKLLIDGWFKSHPFFLLKTFIFLFIFIKRDFCKQNRIYGLDKQNSGRCEELIKEIKDNARVTAIVEPTKLNSMGTGANEGGPVATTSVNTLPTSTKGIIE